ncbi:cullin-3-like [Teleopsis dalmanni]|uniref:cullin-3-like n=1 Tax=Teleopsis dalmanni TaxID=139649 RepID=UPI0018CF67A6|nr:cullin-3-like [Teleopsis dalmanni]
MDECMILADFAPHLDLTALDGILHTLKDAFQEIQRYKGTKYTFEELYRRTYNLVLHKQGKRLYIVYRQVVADHLKTNVLANIKNGLQNNFLLNLNKAWADYQLTTGMMCDILMYLDRIHVQQRGLVSTYNLSLLLFRDHIIREQQIRDAIRDNLLELIDEERSGKLINQDLVRNICEMLIKMGIDSREHYVSIFENHHLAASGLYYKAKSQIYLAANDACAFLSKIEDHIAEECNRVTNYLDKGTEPLIIKVIEENLIRKNIRILIDMPETGVWCMLQHSRYEDLARLYKVFQLINEEGVKIIAETVSEYLRKQSEVLIPEENSKINAVFFVKTLLSLKDQFEEILLRSFDDNATLRRQVMNDMEFLVNMNRSSAEYISLYIHDELVKGSVCENETQTNLVLDNVMVLHRYLEDKDIFERFYQIHLARRLLIHKHIIEDLELNMISRLKTEIGYMYTKNLDGMFKDRTLSKIINDEFKDMCVHRRLPAPSFDLAVSVLTTAYWPVPSKSPNCIIPTDLQIAFETFKTVYLEKYPGKILILQPQFATGILSANINAETQGSGNDRRYVLDVTTAQMCILLLFNESKVVSYETISKETDLSEKDLFRALTFLAKGKKSQRLLLRSSETHSKSANPSDKFTLNSDYWSKYSRVSFYNMSYYECNDNAHVDRKVVKQSSEQDRRVEIDAAIVRIMKSSKTMTHSNLVSEVMNQVKSRFVPSVVVIKSEIDSLISKDYLVRADKDRNTYIYVA